MYQLLLLLCVFASLTFGQGNVSKLPSSSSSSSSAAIACAGSPGATIGSYRQQCQTGAGAIYTCNNASGCTAAIDWVSVIATALASSGSYLTDGTSYYGGPHNALLTRPIASDTAWVNQGGATLSGTTGDLVLFGPHASSDSLRVRAVSIGANTTLTGQFACSSRLIDNNSCFIGLRESGTGKIESFGIEMGTTSSLKLSINRWTDATTFGSSALAADSLALNPEWVSYRIIYTSGAPGTVTFQTSNDDVNWLTRFSEAVNVAFTTAPNQFIYGVNVSNATANADVYMSLYSWKLQ